MSVRLAAITMDCADATELAAFWSAAVDAPVKEGANTYLSVIEGDGSRPEMMFLKVPEGKSAKNRCHLDFYAADPADEVIRLIGLGAKRVGDKAEFGIEWTVLTDPSGNEFCVAAARD